VKKKEKHEATGAVGQKEKPGKGKWGAFKTRQTKPAPDARGGSKQFPTSTPVAQKISKKEGNQEGQIRTKQQKKKMVPASGMEEKERSGHPERAWKTGGGRRLGGGLGRA